MPRMRSLSQRSDDERSRLAGAAPGSQPWNLLKESEIGKPGSCNLLRHTAATLMLEGGANEE